MHAPDIAGTTGCYRTDYTAKTQSALALIENYDLVAVHVASPADSDPRLLRELAKASEVEVRLAVARNLYTAYFTLKRRLLKDPDADVRDAASKNLRHARRMLIRIGE